MADATRDFEPARETPWRTIAEAFTASAAQARNANDLLILSAAAAVASEYAAAQEDPSFQAALAGIVAGART